MFSGCLEIIERGTRNSRRQRSTPSGLRFNICDLETSYLPNSDVEDLEHRISQNVSPELQYSIAFWLAHYICSRCAVLDIPGVIRFVNQESSELQGVPSTPINPKWGLDDEDKVQAKVVDLLCSISGLYWLEAMSLCGHLPTARSILVGVAELLVRLYHCSHPL